ncbi:MAG: peptidase T [Bacteroidia bacterium]|nr:peptidase T [Bacteroidia bacterium]
MENKVVERFLKYVRTNTCSDSKSGTTPSSAGQTEFAGVLSGELKNIGLQDVEVDQFGYVYATLPANIAVITPVVGFIAHMDTSPDFTGANVSPRIIESYPGGDIVLNEVKNIVLSPEVFPEINNYIGQRLIVTDGKTLLGADDKAGIAEIVTAMEYLVNHDEIKHGKVRIAFTPDEEIGEGADHFDVHKFGVDFAYTIDGGELGELEFENFNASGAKIVIHGSSVHPGYAKGKMKNAIMIANQLIAMLPPDEVPEQTDGYEGFYHVTRLIGSVEHAEIEFILRDFTREGINKRKLFLQTIVKLINKEFGDGTAELALNDQYFNMREKIEPVKYIVDIAAEAMRESGVEPKIVPIRGGTDGARLSYMGLPCPNIFNGGHNFHGKFEYIPTPSMAKACEVIVKIVEKVGKGRMKNE